MSAGRSRALTFRDAEATAPASAPGSAASSVRALPFRRGRLRQVRRRPPCPPTARAVSSTAAGRRLQKMKSSWPISDASTPSSTILLSAPPTRTTA